VRFQMGRCAIVGVDVYRGSKEVPGTLWVPAEIRPPCSVAGPRRVDEDVDPYCGRHCTTSRLIMH